MDIEKLIEQLNGYFEELEAELEEAKRNQCLGADCPWRHTAI